MGALDHVGHPVEQPVGVDGVLLGDDVVDVVEDGREEVLVRGRGLDVGQLRRDEGLPQVVHAHLGVAGVDDDAGDLPAAEVHQPRVDEAHRLPPRGVLVVDLARLEVDPVAKVLLELVVLEEGRLHGLVLVHDAVQERAVDHEAHALEAGLDHLVQVLGGLAAGVAGRAEGGQGGRVVLAHVRGGRGLVRAGTESLCWILA